MIAAFLYIKNDIRRRGGNFALNVLVLTLLMLITLNIFTVFEGMHEYELADAPEYDLVFGYLDDADVRTISADADVLSVRLKEINGVRHVYITLRESRPENYVSVCLRLLKSVNAFEKYEYYSGFKTMLGQGTAPPGWVNSAHMQQAQSDPLAFYFIFLIFFIAAASLFSILLYSAQSDRLSREKAQLRSMGMKPSAIALMDVVYFIFELVPASAAACILNLLTMLPLSRLAQDNANGRWAVFSYVFPLREFVFLAAGLSAAMTAAVFIIQKRRGKIPIIAALNGAKTIYLPYVARSDKRFGAESADIAEYGRIYMKRTLRSAAKRLFINILLLLLPVMLILMGSFLRTNRAFFDREQFGDISLYGGGTGIVSTYLTDDTVRFLETVQGVSRVEAAKAAAESSSYLYINIFLEKGEEAAAIAEIKEYASDNALQYKDCWTDSGKAEAAERIYLVFFMIETALALAGSLAVLPVFYSDYLSGRSDEFIILKQLGATRKQVISILKSDAAVPVLAVALGSALSALVFTLASSSFAKAAFDVPLFFAEIFVMSLVYCGVIFLVYRRHLNMIFAGAAHKAEEMK